VKFICGKVHADKYWREKTPSEAACVYTAILTVQPDEKVERSPSRAVVARDWYRDVLIL
jgi:hypothetical protein